MMRTTGEETPQGWPLLYLTQIERQTHRQRDQQVDAEADSRQARTKQPEARAQTLAFAGLHASRRPHRRNQVLERQEQKGHGHIEPIGEEGWGDESAKTA